jgi:hypothetical protein
LLLLSRLSRRPCVHEKEAKAHADLSARHNRRSGASPDASQMIGIAVHNGGYLRVGVD